MQEKQIGEPSSISPKLLKNKRHKNNIKLKKIGYLKYNLFTASFF